MRVIRIYDPVKGAIFLPVSKEKSMFTIIALSTTSKKKSCVYFTSEMFQLKVIACWQRYLRLSCDNLAIYFFSALSSWNCRVHFHSRSFRSVYISFPYQINFRPSLHNRFRYNFPSGGDGVVAKDTSEGN